MNLVSFEDGVVAWLAAVTGVAASRIWWDGQGVARPSTPGVWLSCSIISAVGRGHDWVRWVPNPLVLAADQVEGVNLATNELALTGHAFLTGDGPLRLTSTGTPPTGLGEIDLWAIRTGADAIQLADNYLDARAGTPINLVDAGVGTHTIACTASTVRTGQEVLHKQEGLRRAVVSVQCFGAPAVGVNRGESVLERMRSKLRLPASRRALKNAGIGVGSIGTTQQLGDETNKVAFEPRAVCEVTFFATSSESEAGSRIDFAKATNTETGEETWSPSNPLA